MYEIIAASVVCGIVIGLYLAEWTAERKQREIEKTEAWRG
jgi:hypothetical protein